MEFSGKIVLVTGAAQGIGAAVARHFAHNGARVAMLDCQADIAGCAEQLADISGQRTLGIWTDVSDRVAVTAAVDHVEETLGCIDILVNVAGILRLAPAIKLTEEDWRDTFAVNCDGVFHLSTTVAQRMLPRRRGCIITVGSNAAATPRMKMAAYAASKAAAHQFTQCLGLELAPHGIRCNIVSPGSTDTPMQQQLWTQPSGRHSVLHGAPDQFRLGIPLQRIATPEDIAAAVAFLASDAARHITLHDLRVDGGATLDA